MGAGDSLGIRAFLRIALEETVPDHSTISRTRRLIDVGTYRLVFVWLLEILAEHRQLRGRTIGIDATTLEANAALRSIVRRDRGEQYEEFLRSLAKESGIETPRRAQLAKLDKKRAKKGSNEDWTHPHDPDARIAKMKDGRTHLAHKAEHAVDMESGAVVRVTVQPADAGDTRTVHETLAQASENMEVVAEVIQGEAGAATIEVEGPAELVCSLNLGLLMRTLYGVGTPRGLQDRGFEDVLVLLLMLNSCFMTDFEKRRMANVTSGEDETAIHHPAVFPRTSAQFLN